MANRRWADRVAFWLLVTSLSVMLVGYVHAQIQEAAMTATQAAFNAAMDERVKALADRVTGLEVMQRYALTGIVGNLVAHLFQVIRGPRRRGRED